MRTPYAVRCIVSFLPLLVVGLAEAALGHDLKGERLKRFHRWGTWRK